MRFAWLTLDSKSVKRVRQKAQKPLGVGDPWAFVFIQPWSIYLSMLLTKFQRLTPNVLTSIALAVSYGGMMLAAVCVLDSRNALALGIALGSSAAALVLDVVDGEVARLRGLHSEMGQTLDAGLWISLPLLWVGSVTLLGEWGLGVFMVLLVPAMWRAYLRFATESLKRNVSASVGQVALSGVCAPLRYLLRITLHPYTLLVALCLAEVWWRTPWQLPLAYLVMQASLATLVFVRGSRGRAAK